MKIVLDPGHQSYGVDTGAQGNGLLEQNLTLDIAQRLKPLLEYNGFEVVMTRTGDLVGGSFNDLTSELQARCNIANNAKADLFISIHINAGGGQGIEVYSLPGGNGEKFAGILKYYLLQQTGFTDRGVKTDKRLYVLANTDMPAVLSENGFIDSSDADKLKDPSFRQLIARAHAKAVCDYAGKEYQEKPTPPIVQPVQTPDKVTQALSLLQQAMDILKG